jgi:phosphopantetheinyl transferase
MPLPVGEEGVEVSLLDMTQLVDTESTAARFLTLREREEYAQLAHPSRRREWLGARVCLKTMLLRRRSVSEPTQCEIVKDASGRPWVSFVPGRPASTAFDCSLSHKGRFAGACASSKAGTMVGVDLEKVSPRLLKLSGAFAGDRQALIRPRPPEERLALLWAVKEACAKATGGGIGMALGRVTCEETAEGRHQVRTGEGLEFQARDFLHDGFVIALCLRTEDGQRQRKGH